MAVLQEQGGSVFPEQLLLQAPGAALSPRPGAQQQLLQQDQSRAGTEPDPAETTATASAQTQAHGGREGCGRTGSDAGRMGPLCFSIPPRDPACRSPCHRAGGARWRMWVSRSPGGLWGLTASQHGRGWQGPLWVTQPNPLPKQGHPEQAAQDLELPLESRAAPAEDPRVLLPPRSAGPWGQRFVLHPPGGQQSRGQGASQLGRSPGQPVDLQEGLRHIPSLHARA